MANPSVPKVSGASGNAEATLSWNPVKNAAKYTIQRSTTPGSGFAEIAVVTVPMFTDAGVINGTAYFYVVIAEDGSGNQSKPSSEVTVTPHDPAIPAIPGTPINVSVTPGDARNTVTWDAVPTTVRYVIKRSTTAGNAGTEVATISATTYVDAGLINGTPYFYTIVAENLGGKSAPSVEVSGTPGTPTPAPTATTTPQPAQQPAAQPATPPTQPATALTTQLATQTASGVKQAGGFIASIGSWWLLLAVVVGIVALLFSSNWIAGGMAGLIALHVIIKEG